MTSLPVKRPRTRGKKGIVGSRWVKTADQWEKIDRGLKVGKNRGPVEKRDGGLKGKETRGENAGSKVQSPSGGTGVILGKQHELKKLIFINLFFYKNVFLSVP